MFLFSSAHHNIFLLKIWIHQYSTCTGFGLSFVCVCLCHRLAGVSPQSPVRGFECDSLGGNCFTARLSPPPHPTPLLSQHPTGRILTKGDAAVNRACSLTKSCDVLPLADGVRHRQCALRMRWEGLCFQHKRIKCCRVELAISDHPSNRRPAPDYYFSSSSIWFWSVLCGSHIEKRFNCFVCLFPRVWLRYNVKLNVWVEIV